MMAKSRPDKLLSKRDERFLIEASQRVLLDGGFPNPERVGCPGEEVLRAIAFREMPLKEAGDFIDHMGCCSPCFIEYSAFREHRAKRKRLEFAFAGVGLLVVIGIGAWLLVQRSGERQITYQAKVLDLRDKSPLRGTEPNPSQTPEELPRAALALSIYLPVGSEPGKYEVEMGREAGKPLAKAEGLAVLREHIAVLEVKLNLAPLHAGDYRLGIRQAGWSWTYFPVVLK